MIPINLSPFGKENVPQPYPNPVVDKQVLSVSGATNNTYTVETNGWYRLVARSAAGSNGDSAGGAGARVEIDLYLYAGWKCLAWASAGTSCGAPSGIAGGSGAAWNGTPQSNVLGGGGRGGWYGRSGGGGGGAAGGGGGGNYRAGNGGGGAGIIVYTGDSAATQSGWQYLVLASGGGGGCGNENSNRSGGASGGAGTNGGKQTRANLAGGTGGYTGVKSADGSKTAANGLQTAGSYSSGRAGVGNAFDVRRSTPVWIGGYTNNNSSTTGACVINLLKNGE